MNVSQTFTIPGRLPGLNEYIKACRSSPYAGNAMKSRAASHVARAIRVSDLAPVTGRVHVHFLWIEPNRKRDKDNIRFGVKFILDALKPLGPRNKFGQTIIGGDGWRHMDGFGDDYDVDPESPRIEVTITEVCSEVVPGEE